MNDEINKELAGAVADIDYFDDVQEAAPVDEKTIERMMELAKEMRALAVEIEADEVALAEKREKHRSIEQGRLPAIMEAIGMASFSLEDGASVVVTPDVKCAITEEHKPAAFAWLRERDFDGIIKSNVTLAFGKGEDERALKAMEGLVENGFLPVMSENVHPATLKSFVKECLENGENIPLTTFSVFEFKKAKVTLPKKSRGRK